MILTKRIYGYENNDKYYKVFVDRLWPRGISKSEAIWNEFKSRYKIELSQKPDLMYRIRDIEKRYGTIVLLFAARDQEHNNAKIIKEYLMDNKL